MTYATTNPYSGEIVATFPDATDAEVLQAIDAADLAFRSWRETSFAARATVMRSAAAILRRDADSYARILTLEMGKLLAEATAEVELSAAIFDYYAGNAERLLAPEALPVADPAEGEATLVHEPLGVLLAIEPWNFPYYQIARIIAPQLSAGNTMLLKHAANVPQSAAAFEALMREAGLPEGGFRNLYATRAQIELIINDPRVHGVALTGSESAGATVAFMLGERSGSLWMLLGAALMVAGIVLHLAESHSHEHEHEAIEHEHAHIHDDPHHAHSHGHPVATRSHSHLHRHEPMRHAHAHVPDEHHAHRH